MTTTQTQAEAVAQRLRATRQLTEELASSLTPEDQVIQSMDDVSPTKWHRAHTTWFFETFVLGPHLPGYRPVHPAYDYLFNSYYEQVGDRHPRHQRGLVSRPTADEVGEYRAAVDRAIDELVATSDDHVLEQVIPLLEIGINHEQQHQELLLMDIKHVFWTNPMRPAYRLGTTATADPVAALVGWVDVAPPGNGIVPIGHDGSVEGAGFAFDNEGPRHDALVRPFRLADRLATEGDWLAFLDDGGYRRAELWLSEGWATVQREGWEAPLYWECDGEDWTVFTLGGTRPVRAATPVTHVSFYEADAFATWSGARLATEEEWELAARVAGAGEPVNDLAAGALHPRPAPAGLTGGVRQLHGDGWEWTASSYRPYPGFRPPPGAIGEYNGKFMCNQMVLRGGAPVTPAGHARPTYRNFFPASARWAFSTVRLAADVDGPLPPLHRAVVAAAEPVVVLDGSTVPAPPAARAPSLHEAAASTDPPTTSAASIDPAPAVEVVVPVVDRHLDADHLDRALRADVLAGLSAEQATLPPKWFYDDRGSELFDRITRLDAYYPTRREREILEREARAIAAASGADTLVELGSGTSDKTRILLDALTGSGQLRRFVPFDVSDGILTWASSTIAERHPGLAVHGVVGDFDLHLDRIPGGGRRMVAFLGGTIGNYEPEARAQLLADLAATLQPGDSLLLGTDLVKDSARLVLAYDDSAGVTAEFNLNVLRVLAAGLDAELDVDGWRHEAVWDPEHEWVEMRLRAVGPQRIAVPSLGIDRAFADGGWIRTEISAKFRRSGVERELATAGLSLVHWWTDAAGDFALSLATKPEP